MDLLLENRKMQLEKSFIKYLWKEVETREILRLKLRKLNQHTAFRERNVFIKFSNAKIIQISSELSCHHPSRLDYTNSLLFPNPNIPPTRLGHSKRITGLVRQPIFWESIFLLVWNSFCWIGSISGSSYKLFLLLGLPYLTNRNTIFKLNLNFR